MGIENLTFADIQHLIAVKICLVAFIVIGFILIYYRAKPWFFLSLTGMLCAAAYLIFLDDLGLLFWGLQGDEVTVSAMYTTVARVGFFSDFAYHGLPPFYPPLYFWLFGFLGRLCGWNGLIMTKVGVAAAYLVLPLLMYGGQRLYWRFNADVKDRPGMIAFFLAPLLLLVLIDHDAFISKPYEVLAAAAAILWSVYLVLDVRGPIWHWRRAVIFGAAGGLIFMTYYLWLILVAIGLAFYGLTVAKSTQLKYYTRLAAVAIISLVVALPYLGPLLYSYARWGAENWQAAFFLPGGLAANFWIFQLISWKSLLMLGGIFVLFFYRRQTYIRILVCLLAAAYTWWLMGLVTLGIWQVPFQEFKGFMFFDRTILALALAFGVERVWLYFLPRLKNPVAPAAVLALAWCLLGVNLFFGGFTDAPDTQARRVQSRAMRPEVAPLVVFLQSDAASWRQLTLQSGINEIAAVVPLNSFIYFNQHNSHPAANFSQRYYYVRTLAAAKNSQEFYELCGQAPFGAIERLILFHQAGKYYVFFNLDEMIKGIKEEAVEIDDALVSEEYFTKRFDQKGFVVWEKKL